MISLNILAVLFFSNSFVLAQVSVNYTTIDPSLCAAPDLYLACYNSAVLTTTQCVEIAAGNTAAVEGCGCGDGVNKINCFASACWNRIYGCEYQVLIAEYFSGCGLAQAPIPYWPAPNNAPGSCSCNTGEILETVGAGESRLLSCYSASLGTLTAVAEEHACDCCGASLAISTLIDICPTTDPTLIGLNSILAFNNKLDVPWDTCGPILADTDCVNSLSFVPPLGTGSMYNPTNTPAPGTETPYNIAGEMTTPASGATFTWSGAGGFHVVTAFGSVAATTSAAVVENSGQGGATATGVAGSTETGAGAGSGSQPASASVSSGSGAGGAVKSSATCWDANGVLLVGIAAMWAVFVDI